MTLRCKLTCFIATMMCWKLSSIAVYIFRPNQTNSKCRLLISRSRRGLAELAPSLHRPRLPVSRGERRAQLRNFPGGRFRRWTIPAAPYWFRELQSRQGLHRVEFVGVRERDTGTAAGTAKSALQVCVISSMHTIFRPYSGSVTYRK